MDEHENVKVAKAAGVVGFATLLSRIFGFLRDMVVAAYFGAGLKTDAFFVAFRIPNLLRRLIGEGSLTVSFVPVFTEYIKTRDRKEVEALANSAFTALSILLAVITILGILFSPLIVTITAPGFRKIPEQYELTVFLTQLMFPYIFFISLVALCMGILNSLRHFAAPALSPVLLNLAMIGAAMFLRDIFSEPVYALAVGVLIGGFLQLAFQWPFLERLGVKLRFYFHLTHPGLRRIGALMFPAVFGAAVYQINVFIGTILASLLPKGSVSYLYYADRIVELPLGVFAFAIGTAALPSLSEQAVDEKYGEMKKTVSFSLLMVFFVTIPATIALLYLRIPIISVLFQRGAFSAVDTYLTAEALLYYTLGLWAFSSVRIAASAFYSLNDTKTPMKGAIVALLVNLFMSLILMGPLKHGGLALATSLGSAANVIYLSYILWKRIGFFLERDFFISLAKVIMASFIMLGAMMLFDYFYAWPMGGSFIGRATYLTFEILIGFFFFVSSVWLLKAKEAELLVNAVARRLGKQLTGKP
ncbi:MAG: murein biosynthesis integral membrane protein MurJ [Syntrophales bacterium]|nr:murein biosynthesis integral membrane protein MurJ [Syntrophales bacterium]